MPAVPRFYFRSRVTEDRRSLRERDAIWCVIPIVFRAAGDGHSPSFDDLMTQNGFVKGGQPVAPNVNSIYKSC
jgi:hypothetical protein